MVARSAHGERQHSPVMDSQRAQRASRPRVSLALNPTNITMLFFAFRRRDAFFVRTPVEITAFSAYWYKASLSCT